MVAWKLSTTTDTRRLFLRVQVCPVPKCSWGFQGRHLPGLRAFINAHFPWILLYPCLSSCHQLSPIKWLCLHNSKNKVRSAKSCSLSPSLTATPCSATHLFHRRLGNKRSSGKDAELPGGLLKDTEVLWASLLCPQSTTCCRYWCRLSPALSQPEKWSGR